MTEAIFFPKNLTSLQTVSIWCLNSPCSEYMRTQPSAGCLHKVWDVQMLPAACKRALACISTEAGERHDELQNMVRSSSAVSTYALRRGGQILYTAGHSSHNASSRRKSRAGPCRQLPTCGSWINSTKNFGEMAMAPKQKYACLLEGLMGLLPPVFFHFLILQTG